MFVLLLTGHAQDGNVGIGTQNPTEKLHIYEGNVFIERTNPAIGEPTLIFSNSGNIHALSGLDIVLDADNSDPTQGSGFAIKRDGESVILFELSESGRAAMAKAADNDRVLFDMGAENSKGFVLPRLNIPDLSLSAPLSGSDPIPNGLLAWNTNTTTGPGLVYWNSDLDRWETVRTSSEPELWMENSDDGTLFPATLSHRVGIGTQSPAGMLHIQNIDDSYAIYGTSGNISVFNPEAFSGEVRLGAAWNRPGLYSSNQLELFSGNTGIVFGNNNVEGMRLTSAGRLGIGIDNPGHPLHIFPEGNASVKIGNTNGFTDNKLYFGDGEHTWIGEPGINNRLQLHSTSLAIEIGGDPGHDGQVLTSDGTTATWMDAYPSAPISDCNITGTYDLPVLVWYGAWGSENSWQLRSGVTWGSGVIISGGSGSDYTTQYNGTVTLNYGQTYYFEARDSYGDGWNDGGYFNLGAPMSTGNIGVSGYGLIFSFSFQVCVNTPTRQRIVRGSIQQDGAIEGGGGFNINSYGGGRYEIEFVPSFSDRPSATVSQIYPDFDSNSWTTGTSLNAVITHLDSQKMRIVTGNSSGTPTDRDFSFVVIGSE